MGIVKISVSLWTIFSICFKNDLNLLLVNLKKMVPYKLYEELSKSSLSIQSNEDIKYISGIKLPEECLEIIYCLIIHHFIITHRKEEKAMDILNTHFQSKRAKKFIYKGERLPGGKGYYFNIKELPTELQNIIFTYIKKISTFQEMRELH